MYSMQNRLIDSGRSDAEQTDTMEDYIRIKYTFHFEERKEDVEFTVVLHPRTLYAVAPEESRETNWTRLSFQQCDICPLNSKKVRNCPIIYNISGVLSRFTDFWSTDPVLVTVDTMERSYTKRDVLQQGLRSLLGIYMATSGCPHMEILKPMARFHLPFATLEETIFRHISTFLMGQYFEHMQGKNFEVDFARMMEKYDLITFVNDGILKRVRSVPANDANVNALLALQVFAPAIKLKLKDNLEYLRYLYTNPPAFPVE